MLIIYDVRARRGARLLDANDSNWYLKIRLEDVDVSNVRMCVLGQLYGYYACGRYAINLACDQTIRHGFNIRSGMMNYARIAAQTRAWTRLIEARRRAAGACGCACCNGGFCGGCGHAGCGRRLTGLDDVIVMETPVDTVLPAIETAARR